MYFTLGNDESLASVRMLAGADGDERPSPAELRAAYMGWLAKKLEPAALGPRAMELELVDDGDVEGRLLRGFVTGDDMGEAAPINDASIAALLRARDGGSIRAKLARVGGALGVLGESDRELAALFSLVVHRVFVAEIAGEVGGSSPKHTGVIWANPPAAASTWDLAEYLVHELTHNLLYLDEHLHGHYREHPDGELLVRSVIRKQARPLRAAFHSLVVGVEVLSLRRRVVDPDVTAAVHPPSEPLMESCQSTIHAIVSSPGWTEHFRPRGRYIFDACRRAWEELARTAPETHHPLFDAC